MKQKIFALAVIMLTLIFSAMAMAANWPATSGIKTYVISTGNDTTVYQTANSTSKFGTIYAEDLITILSYSGSRLQVSYPTSKGPKVGYIDKSRVTSARNFYSKGNSRS